jgi:hypothetical protein
MGLRIARAAAVAALVGSSVVALSAADPARKAFVESWRGRRVEVRRPLITLVFNERGKLGKVYHDKREGLVVVTPSAGTYLQFDGRDNEVNIVAREPQQVIDRIGESYRRQDALEIGFYLRIEPLLIVRYEARGALIVRDAQIDRNRVRVWFGSVAGDAPAEQLATALTVQWPADFSPSFTERPLVEGLIRQFVDDGAGDGESRAPSGIRD